MPRSGVGIRDTKFHESQDAWNMAMEWKERVTYMICRIGGSCTIDS